MKKVMVSLLVVALVIGCFAGCGKKEKGDLQQQAVSRDYVYKQEVISYNGSGTAPSGLIQIGIRFMVTAMNGVRWMGL